MHFSITHTRLTAISVSRMVLSGKTFFTLVLETLFYINNTLENQHDMADEYQRIKDEILGIKRDQLIARAASR